MSSERPSYAPISPTAARSTSSTSSSSNARSRSIPRQRSRNDLSTPARSSHASTNQAVPPLPTTANFSPHYQTSLRSRHSLYGTEDRVVLDLGSRVWKVGFSGEPSPRWCVGVEKLIAKEQVQFGTTTATARGDDGDTDKSMGKIWGFDKGEQDDETWLIREERLKRGLRDVWFDHLMTDPKTRKVLVLENPLLSTRVKEMIARVLFDNIQVPSVNFASTPLLALMASGSVTGLVVDVGHLETTILPIFHARPLFPHLVSTPLAGSRVNARLRSLLLAYGSYAPPPTSLNSMTIPQPGRIPRSILTEELIEEIKTRCVFVGDEFEDDERLLKVYDDELAARNRREGSTSTTTSSTASPMDVDSSAGGFDEEALATDPDLPLLKYLYQRYSRSCPSTTSLAFRIPHLSQTPPPSGVGLGHLLVPSWIRERCAEILFDSTLETEDCPSIQTSILECLLKLPIDLRKTMAQRILVVGGTASLPGFIPRLKRSILTRLEQSHPPSPPPSPPLPTDDETGSPASSTDPASRIRRNRLQNRLHNLRHSPRYAPLVPLASTISIVNHPAPSSPPSTSVDPSPNPNLRSTSSAPRNATIAPREGSAPPFHPALYSWVGGSLSGALKLGGPEVLREEWDEWSTTRTIPIAPSNSGEAQDESMQDIEEDPEVARERAGRNLPDWTRISVS